ncbi:MAG TPA: TonB-dependent siderophore receptor [Gemmatimonadaceae bacterium]|jgi:catecholate siderophore receptor
MSKKQPKKPNGRRRASAPAPTLALGVLAATSVGAAVPAVARAQGVEARSRSNQAAAPKKFDIPAGPLAEGLNAFERSAELTLRINAPIAGLQTKGVTGELTPQQALIKLLDGTGLSFVFTGGKVVMVRKSGGTTVLDAVTVTADAAARVASPKYTEAQVDIPRSVSVIPSTIIQAQGATSLRDVVRNVPGITMNAGEGGALPGDNFNIRGFSATNDIFVDGVRDVSGYSREAFNLEQIEVIKGPNSAVNGRGSTGGSINMVTKSPHLNDNRGASLVLGSADQRRGTIDLNQTIPVDALRGAALRFNAVKSDAGVSGNDVVENNGWGIAPSLAIGLLSPTHLTLAYTRTGQDNTPAYGLETFTEVPTVDTRHFFGLRTLDFEKVQANTTTARLEHSFNEHVQFRNQLSRDHSDVNRIVTPANPTTGVRSPKTHIFANETVTNQTDLTTSFSTGLLAHTLVGGVEVNNEHSTRGVYTIANKPYPVIADLNNPSADDSYSSAITETVTRKVKASTVGIYLFENLKAGSHVELSGGLRYDNYKPQYTDSASVASGFAPPRVHFVSGNAALSYKPVEEGSIYASYGTSFNPSTENLSNDALSAATTLPPEKSRTYEVGTKWEVFKRRMLSTFALFRTDKINARTSDPNNPGLGTILDGKQRVQGAEANLTGSITRKWTAMAGYSYLESKYVESANAAQVGTAFTNVPKHSVNTWTSYALTKKIEVGGGGRYVDRRLLRTTTTNGVSTSVYVPSYHTYDAMASYQIRPAIGLQLNVYNLSDELYYDSGRMWVPAAARAFSITTNVKF